MRHAEVHNPKDILYGRMPRFGLNQRGVRQSHAAARFLGAREVKAVYSSPMLRARQTAEIITGCLGTMKTRLTRDLIEVKTGYQGSSNEILKPGFSFFDPLKDPDDETLEDVCHRMLRFVRRAARRHPGQTVVAVSHADPITILRVGLENLPVTVASTRKVVYPARASVTQVQLSPEEPPRLTYFNVADVEELKL